MKIGARIGVELVVVSHDATRKRVVCQCAACGTTTVWGAEALASALPLRAIDGAGARCAAVEPTGVGSTPAGTRVAAGALTLVVVSRLVRGPKGGYSGRPRDWITLAAFDVELSPHHTDRIVGVVKVQLAAPLAAGQCVLLMLAHERMHCPGDRVPLCWCRLPIAIPLSPSAIEIPHQTVGADEHRPLLAVTVDLSILDDLDSDGAFDLAVA